MSTRRACPRCRETKHIVSGNFCTECERALKAKAAAEAPLRVFALTLDAADPLRARVSASAMLAGLGGRIARA